VPIAQVKQAQKNILTQLHSEQAKAMDELNKGEKPDEKTTNMIVKVANEVTKSYKKETKSTEDKE